VKSLWFIVPAHGRHDLTRICLGQLRRTCDQLKASGVDATAVVIACDENLDTARGLGFGTVERNNRFLSRKYNDGIQVATDPAINPRPADYIVPCGSDDWVDHRLFTNLPPDDTIVGFQTIAFVHPSGEQIATTKLRSVAGCGIRIYPAVMMEPFGYRPGDEDRVRACDTSILYNVQRRLGNAALVEHRYLHDRQIVDWKSPDQQVTPWESIIGRHSSRIDTDPFDQLTGFYPEDALDAMRVLYAHRRLVAA